MWGKSKIERFADLEARIGRSDNGEPEDPPISVREWDEMQREYRKLGRQLGIDLDSDPGDW